MMNPEFSKQHYNHFINKFRNLRVANEEELAIMTRLFIETSFVEARTEFVVEEQRRSQIHILLDGWGYSYRILSDGERQIMTVLLPGDVCDLSRLHLGRVNYAVQALTPCTVASFECSAVRTLAAHHPGISAGLGCLSALENASLVERTIGLGRHSAHKRLAHLFCELLVRLGMIGHTHKNSYALPMTQTEIADLLGITPIHLNRVLQDLRSKNVIKLERFKLTIIDLNYLIEIGEFQSCHLFSSRMMNKKFSFL